MFQTSSEGGNPGVGVRQNVLGERIRFYFLLSCELDLGRPSLTFHFYSSLSKQNHSGPSSDTLNRRPPAANLFG